MTYHQKNCLRQTINTKVRQYCTVISLKALYAIEVSHNEQKRSDREPGKIRETLADSEKDPCFVQK